MRRYVYILLFFLVLVAPFLLRMAVTRGDSAGGDGGAGRESGGTSAGAARLVIITPHNQDIRNEFARAFTRWHQREYGRPVVLDFRVPGGSNDVRRVLENSFRPYRDPETKLLPPSAYIQVDLVWGGGDYFFDVELKPLGLLQPVAYDAKLLAEAYPQPTLAGAKLYDMTPGDSRPPTWVGVCLSSFGIAYNSDVCDAIGFPPPTKWHDLTDPRLNGMLALADPQRSASASVAFNMVIQRAMADAELAFPAQDLKRKADLELRQKAKESLTDREREELPILKKAYDDALSRGWQNGMADLLLIAANARYFTDMANNVPLDVGNGQAAAGMCIDFYGRVFQESVGPRRCTFVAPRGATATTADPIAILNGVSGERLQIARHFVEYLLTREGQLLWIQRPGTPGGPSERALRRPPIRRDLYVQNRPYWTDDVNPFAEAEGFNSRGEWSATLTETRLIWAAAWMDSRKELKDAYDAILKLPPGPNRDDLLTSFATLPVERKDVEALRTERKKLEITDPNKIEEWKAQQRIDWANKFRKHYRTVAAAAKG